MDLTGGLAQQVAALPSEVQPIVAYLMDRIDALEGRAAQAAAALEAQTAKDVNADLTDLINAIAPVVAAINRFANGAIVTIDIAPKPPA